MKRIFKNAEPLDFANWKSAHPAATYADLRDDVHFPGANNARRALRASLVSEQKGLCCYCESKIADGNFHVEHFRPKDITKFPHLQLDYSNLHASCHIEPIGGADECCGHNKKNEFSSDLISPLDSDCESHFGYNAMGEIIGIDKLARIVHTVESISFLRLKTED